MNNADFWASVRTIIAEGEEAKVYDHGATLVKSIGLDYFIQPIFALDCDIRINTPELRQGGRRTLTTEVRFL